MKWREYMLPLFASTLLLCGLYISLVSTAKYESAPQVASARTSISLDPIMAEINSIRQTAGLRPIVQSDELLSVTRERANDMLERNYYAHYSPEGATYQDIFSKYGIESDSYSCENLLLFPATSSQDKVRHWMASQSHRACLLDERLSAGAVIDVPYASISYESGESSTNLTVLILREGM